MLGLTTSTLGAVAVTVIGVSAAGSKLSLANRCWLIDTGPGKTESRVWPSGAARKTNSAAMFLVAPGLFSTMTVWFQRALSFSARRRGSVSGTEPGPVGATSVT